MLFQDFAFLEVSEERQMNEERAQKKGFEDTRSLERRIQKDHELLQQKMRQQERPKQIPTPRQKYIKSYFAHGISFIILFGVFSRMEFVRSHFAREG